MGEWWRRPAVIAGIILGGGVLAVFALMAATVGVFFAGAGAGGSQAGASTPALTGNLAALAAQLGVPERALEGVVLVDRASADRVGCRAPWWLLLSVSVEESGAGTHGGASIGPDWVVRPAIGGPLLTGDGYAAIDFGGAPDRARGPFQFISSSWLAMGEDFDGDGVADVDNFLDAALGAANHLCLSSGGRGGDLAVEATARRGLWGYNASQPYQDEIWARAMSYLAQGGDQPTTGQAASVAPPGAPTGNLVDLPAWRCDPMSWGTTCQLDESWAPNLLAALDAAEQATGLHYRIVSANRTYEKQAQLWACYQAGACGLAARPGTSNHEGGQAVDLRTLEGGPLSGPGDPAWDALMAVGPPLGVQQSGSITGRDSVHFSATGN